MIFSLSLHHLTKLLIIFSCLPLNGYALPVQGPNQRQQLGVLLSLRQTRSIKPIATTTTTPPSTRPPFLTPTTTKRSAKLADVGPEVFNKSSRPTSAATTTRIPHKTMKQLGYTPLGVTIGRRGPDQSAVYSPSTLDQALRYRLPSWFNYERYKRFYGKHYARSGDDEVHKRIYLRTALKVFEQRALYRAGRIGSLSSINELSDLTSDELETFKHRARKRLTGRRKPDPLATATELECCTYDQVYSRIIELLNKTSNNGDGDLVLSRALVEELEQKSLVGEKENEQVTDGNGDDRGGSGGDGGGSTTDDGQVNGNHAVAGKLELASEKFSPGSKGKLIRSSSLWKPMTSGGDGGISNRSETIQQQQQPIGSQRNLIGPHDERWPPSKLIAAQELDTMGRRLTGSSGSKLPSQRQGNGTLLLEASPLIESKSQPQPSDPSAPLYGGRHWKQSGQMMGSIGANEAEEIGNPTSDRPTKSLAPSSANNPRPRTGNWGLTIGEAHKARPPLEELPQAVSGYKLAAVVGETGASLWPPMRQSNADLSGSNVAAAAAAAASDMLELKTATKGNILHPSHKLSSKKDSGNTAGSPATSIVKTPTGFAGLLSDNSAAHMGGHMGTGMQAARSPLPTTANSDSNSNGSPHARERDQPTSATDEIGAASADRLDASKQEEEEGHFDEPELSSAERSIAESVRRQVEQQLSSNSTIGRQLTERFSAYYGEPVVVKASIDEAAIKEALRSARGSVGGGERLSS